MAVLGGLMWPVGFLGFGGFGERTGAAIVGAGSLLVVASLAAEFALRWHSSRS